MAPQATRVLVVGPGPGEQLPDLLNTCPEAELTILEPSQQMLLFCREAIADHAGRARCILIQEELNQQTLRSLEPIGWDLVVCHNVLHLYEANKQVSLLRLLARCTALNGLLLLSGYSEPSEQNTAQQMMDIGLQRLRDRDLSDDRIETIRSSRNKDVFSIDSNRVSSVLSSEELTPALQLYQGLFSRLWVSTRQGAEFK
ncbi:class I SAM-dependent methyltransferase [Synechococcus sp. BIOS-E4-1]|uniref:class I SAM-dependent methyltransferase n=1 Tax=Synechococcus sp. BIOS-E4-1 TaxID=1400864 RepID=UPI00164576D1|nr:class I SAM-dependent methyltransferase [Synechococcus sp. BIOS-E4-1]